MRGGVAPAFGGGCWMVGAEWCALIRVGVGPAVNPTEGSFVTVIATPTASLHATVAAA